MVKIINTRLVGGHLFHYAHFMCDLVFPEIINQVYKYKHVYRRKTIDQTIGNFKKIWEEIFGIPTYEIEPEEFDQNKEWLLRLGRQTQFPPKVNFMMVQNYILERFKIKETLENLKSTNKKTYPRVLLIEREGRVSLIDDPKMKKISEVTVNGVSTGKERRDIHDIETLKKELANLYPGTEYECITLAGMDFAEQVRYFHSADIIILAHGAAQANTLFCRPGTLLLEVTCDCSWQFFDVITTTLEMHHMKCKINEPEVILDMLKDATNKLARGIKIGGPPKHNFYICSYGGCGSTMLARALHKFGNVQHIHSRQPPHELTFTGKNGGSNTYGEWFNSVKIPENQLENYTVIYLYRNPVNAIFSRFKNSEHLKHIQTDKSIQIEDIIEEEMDLYGIINFYRNYTINQNASRRNYSIYCVKYEELFEKQEELCRMLKLDGSINLVKKESKKDLDEIQVKALNTIYKPLLDVMSFNPFIFIV